MMVEPSLYVLLAVACSFLWKIKLLIYSGTED